MIVDDEDEVRNLLTFYMESAGCEQIDTAETGSDALVLALRTTYDLITLDILMSEAGGLDVLPALRAACPYTIIAVISGFTEVMGSEEAEMANVVIDKPFSSEKIHDLAQLAREIAERHTAIRALGA